MVTYVFQSFFQIQYLNHFLLFFSPNRNNLIFNVYIIHREIYNCFRTPSTCFCFCFPISFRFSFLRLTYSRKLLYAQKLPTIVALTCSAYTQTPMYTILLTIDTHSLMELDMNAFCLCVPDQMTVIFLKKNGIYPQIHSEVHFFKKTTESSLQTIFYFLYARARVVIFNKIYLHYQHTHVRNIHTLTGKKVVEKLIKKIV